MGKKARLFLVFWVLRALTASRPTHHPSSVQDAELPLCLASVGRCVAAVANAAVLTPAGSPGMQPCPWRGPATGNSVHHGEALPTVEQAMIYHLLLMFARRESPSSLPLSFL